MTADEIEIFRDARPEAAPYDPFSKARARARLLDGPGPAPRHRFRWVLVTSIATAGALAAGLLFLNTTEPAGTEPKMVLSSLQPVSAAAYLEEFARIVEKRPEIRPRPHQWLYKKTRIKDSAASYEHVAESWMRLDGRMAASPNGPERKIVLDEQHPRKNEQTPLKRYDRLRTLSTDPEKLLARAYKAVDDGFAEKKAAIEKMQNPYRDFEAGELKEHMMEDNRHHAAYHRLAELFEGVLTPPRLHAAAFRAIAKIPGVEVLPEGTDLLGRPVVTVARMNQYGLRHEYLLDPATYVSLGQGAVVVRNDLRKRSGGAALGKDGQITPFPIRVRPIGESSYELREYAGIVDEAGQLPR
ncbi:CU044_5270 family protein [Actinocorallia populi]|uniref:CU044_5270 family protein n=1 Tax=Actinocorallia populi TaxID=2079200 RepID=UPI000D089701|nr:CU044_5270 family protein [Actinocorallia populi]